MRRGNIMKAIRFISIITFAMLVLTSCSSLFNNSADGLISEPAPQEELPMVKAEMMTSGDLMPGGESMLPMRYIAVTNEFDFDSPLYTIIGEVRGFGRVNADNPEDGGTHMYGKLVLDEVSAVDGVTMEGTAAYDVSLSNAVYELIEDAWAKGAQFVIFPTYTVNFTEDRYIETTVKAIAVKVNTTDGQ